MANPSVFVGSSSEGLDFARAIRAQLELDAEVTLWNEGLFQLGSTFIETLISSLARFDFAVLVMTADDMVTSRDTNAFSARDNVIFELGLFMGRLGRSRTFVVHESNPQLRIPSDLSGIVLARYDWPRDDRSHRGAVGSACDCIRQVIRDLGVSEAKAERQINLVWHEQRQQRREIDALSFLVSHFLPYWEINHLERLASDSPFPYDISPSFEREIRHLWGVNFIEKISETKIAEMPRQGDLRHFFRVTDQGLAYLGLRREAREPEEAPPVRHGFPRI